MTWCAKTGTSLEGATVYSTDRPCILCTKLLYSAGVIEVVYAREYPNPLPDLPRMKIRQWAGDLDDFE